MNAVQTLSCQIIEASQVAAARRDASGLAHEAGISENTIASLMIVVTELATNLLKHAKGGELLMQRTRVGVGSAPGIELLALDTGPGVANFQECMRDGYSTTSTPGTGLGAIVRLSDYFEAHSRPGQGTAVFTIVREGARSGQRKPEREPLGGVQVAMSGEKECGDMYCIRDDADTTTLLMVDGLGHGHEAAAAARVSATAFLGQPLRSPRETMESVHGAMRPTRGGAGAVAQVHHREGLLVFSGVGNIGGAVFDGHSAARHMVSMNGTLGHEVRKFSEFSYPWTRESILVMASDGLGTRWNFDSYPGLTAKHPALIAGVLYRDFSRRRDDATVAVLRGGRP